jgi:hypothetical protein
MPRVWFNKTFSSLATALQLILQADTVGRYQLLASNTHPHALAALAAHQYFQEPGGLLGTAYLDWCLQQCRERQIDIMLPGKEAALISAERERFAAHGTRILAVATPEVLHLLHDKARFYQEVSLPLTPPPEFCVVQTIEQFDAGWQQLRARHERLCIKPASSVYGLGYALIDETRDSAQLLLAGAQYQIGRDDLRRGLAAQGEFRTMLLMQYLAGVEYSVDCIADQGQLQSAVVRQKSPQAGYGQLICQRADILQACATLCADYQLNGNVNVQFRESHASPNGVVAQENRLHLLEINPRMSGGIGMACLAGPNLPYLALAGFDLGYAGLTLPAIEDGLRVGEWPHATRLP